MVFSNPDSFVRLDLLVSGAFQQTSKFVTWNSTEINELEQENDQ